MLGTNRIAQTSRENPVESLCTTGVNGITVECATIGTHFFFTME